MWTLKAIWNGCTGGDTTDKAKFISAILSIVIGTLTIMRMLRNNPEKRAAEDSERLRRIEIKQEETLSAFAIMASAMRWSRRKQVSEKTSLPGSQAVERY